MNLTWLFHNEQRLRAASVGLAVAVVMLGLSLLGVRAHSFNEHRIPDVVATPKTTSTALVPPTTDEITPSPTPEYGDSAPIALQAVQAWMLHDVEKFSQIAEPAATEEFAAATPAPAGGRITGEPVTVEPGPTQQVIDVPTSLGTMRLRMHVIAGAWLVEGMEYQR